MEELRRKFDELNTAFIEHRARSEAGHKAIVDDVDELKTDFKDLKTEVTKEFDEVEASLEKLNTSINDLKLVLAKTWTFAFPKDPKIIAIILVILASLGLLGPSGVAIADKALSATDATPIIEQIKGTEPDGSGE